MPKQNANNVYGNTSIRLENVGCIFLNVIWGNWHLDTFGAMTCFTISIDLQNVYIKWLTGLVSL